MLAFVLAGCTQSSDYWYRAANKPDQTSSDERDCRDEATQVARSRSRQDAAIYQDRTATSDSASVSRSDLNVSGYERIATNERQNIRELVRSCMADRGYRLRHDD
ncbi:MAG: hypothetical protein WDO24_16525 [Pseudomonadota bacterium]